MFIRLNPESDAPLFAQIAASVRADALAGRLHAGDRLPAAREVADAIGVNVHTVLHAYQLLRDEGLVELRRGRGAVLTERTTQLALLEQNILNLIERARELGLSTDTLTALIKESSS